MSYTCHSGGCPGSDLEWEQQGEKYGVKTISYSFYNHVQYGKTPKVLSVDELAEGWTHVKIADRTLKKNVEHLDTQYVRNLLCRNWFQVKNAQAIFAIGLLETAGKVKGGTGWAVQMAIDNFKPVYLNDQVKDDWLCYDYGYKMFLPKGGEIPILTENFAGIGTRAINEYGKRAIQQVYEQSFRKS